MIVYTATDEVSHKVYVGSAREDLEEHWISLVNQAEDGAEGEFFAAIRQQGANKFEIEEFGYADDSAEMRELMREAQKDLGATPIKAGRSSSVISKTKVAAKADLDALLKLDGEADSGWGDALECDDDWLGKESGRGQESKAKDNQAKEYSVAESGSARQGEQAKSSKPASSLDLIKQALAEAALDTAPVKAIKRSRPKAATKPSAAVKPKAEAAPAKLATGRTGSAAKEKRIKAAIQEEREAREQFRQTGSTAEAAEMKDLMMGIEARRLAARKTSKTAKLAEAKKKAAADRKAAAADKVAEAKRVEAMKKALASRKAEPETVEEKPAPTKRDSRAEAKLLAAKVLAARTGKVVPAVNTSEGDSAKVKDIKTKPTATLKLASGRTGSANKEKRIKEAIAAEKARLDAEKQAKVSAESSEMAALLAGLDARGKAAASYKRKR